MPSPLWLTCIAACLATACSVHYFHGLSSIHDLTMVGILDENGKTKKQTLIVFGNRGCFENFYSLSFPFDYLDLPDEVFEFGQVLTEPSNELTEMFHPSQDCRSFAFIPAGSDLRDRSKVSMASFTKAPDLEEWFWKNSKMDDLHIVNDLGNAVSVFWESRLRRNELKHVIQLEPGQIYTFSSFYGHAFVFRSAEDNSFLARRILTNSDAIVVSQMLAEKGDSEVLQLTQRQVEIWWSRHNTNRDRLIQNERQPPKLKRYTEKGYKKSKMPEIVYRQMQDFLRSHEDYRVDEGWSVDDVHVNFYKKMTTVVHLDDQIRQLVFSEIQPQMEAWSKQKLVPTSFYGIRRYYNESLLRDHVDIGQTHVISAIFNIAQDIDSEWYLHILDHDGQRQFITMAPGEMVYYESASKLHGRPMPLQGTSYDNAFIHYRPLNYALDEDPVHMERFEERPQTRTEEEEVDLDDMDFEDLEDQVKDM